MVFDFVGVGDPVGVGFTLCLFAVSFGFGGGFVFLVFMIWWGMLLR